MTGSPTEPGERKRRILIADDVAANIDIVQARLNAHGYETLTATNGEEALAMVREHKPDLVLLDVMMPKMDGLEVCRHVRADQSIPFVPIIMLTAKADTSDVVAGLEAGADEYLTKPFDKDALIARVKSMLRIKDLHDERHAQALQLEAQAPSARPHQRCPGHFEDRGRSAGPYH